MQQIKLFILLFCFQFSFGQQLFSPNRQLQLHFIKNEKGEIFYQLYYKNKEIIKNSKLGFLISSSHPFSEGFEIKNIEYQSSNTEWNPVWGEEKTIKDQHQEMLVSLEIPETKWLLHIRFRLFDDGLGFRYEFPVQSDLRHFRFDKEFTEFNVNNDAKAFWIPSDYDTNEFPISISKISEIASQIDHVREEPLAAKAPSPTLAVQTPLLLKTTQGVYINIHEAALVNYPAMHLNIDNKNLNFNVNLAPNKNGELAFLQTQMTSPWRTLIVSDQAKDILKSRLILNLNEPSKIKDTSWIKPMKYMGVWWDYFIGRGSTWAYSGHQDIIIGKTDYQKLPPNHHHPAHTENVKKYIDFASENGFDAVLVEGWNEGWEDNWAYGKEEIYSFTKPYPDFDIENINAYAHSKNINLIMHHETTSSVVDYERQLDEAFRLMKKYRYPAVKTGYVGRITPKSEYHDGQWMVNHHIEVAKKAAEYQLMVNSHEATRPTGLHRTYPNWIAQESTRGTEFESFNGNHPNHTCILPFTRLVSGPMDYTPGIFQGDLSVYGTNKAKLSTTLVKQLALYVTLYSPLQMAADLPENYTKYKDAFQFIKDVAVDWDNTYILEAEPGEYITTARKSKNKNEWFVGGITNENQRTASIDMSFLPEGKKYIATIYKDGDHADYKKSIIDYSIINQEVSSKSQLKIKLAASGGVAIKIIEKK